MKQISSSKDLAIYGAPPAFDQPLHVGRPNISSQETFLKLAGEMFGRHWLSNDGPLVQEFERRIADYHLRFWPERRVYFPILQHYCCG